MFTWISGISNIFGYVLNFIYNIVGNYGIAMIIFTIIAKIIMAPFTYFQQKNAKKTTLISEELKKVQEKYKGNEKKIQEETMRVYKDNNTSPFTSCSSCFTVLIQMIIMIAMIYLISEPLTYMRKIDKNTYRQYEIKMYKEIYEERKTEWNKNKTEEELKEQEKQESEEKARKKEENKEKSEEQIETEELQELKEKIQIARPQMLMISKFKDENEAFNINMNFLGLDLTQIPSTSLKKFNIKEKETYKNLLNIIIPLLYIASSIGSIIYTTKKSKKKQQENKKDTNIIEVKVEKENKEEKSLQKLDDDKLNADDINEAMQDASKSMIYFMPIMMFFITMNQPQSLALYWFVGNIYTFIEKFIIDIIVNKKESEESDIKVAVKVEEKKKK